ncbi:MAG TPA: aminoacyl-tRNA hydrolase [Patescibacteria group bacterium]|nr:aminoacyl-tRNA hydrolase [Patescibacteria group bacterium]
MKLIIGLGNPGSEYKATRHNIGFQFIDALHRAWETQYHFAPWSFSKRFNAEISEGKIRNKKILLLKPQTFMNESGRAARAASIFYKIQTKDFLVVYDDLDLPFGSMRLRIGGSSAGHKGLQSIIDAFGTNDIPRLRLGIRNDNHKTTHEAKIFVLKKFTIEEIKQLPLVFTKAQRAIETSLLESFSKAMSLYNELS